MDFNKTLSDLEDPQSDSSEYDIYEKVKPKPKIINLKHASMQTKRKLQIKSKSLLEKIKTRESRNIGKCELFDGKLS